MQSLLLLRSKALSSVNGRRRRRGRWKKVFRRKSCRKVKTVDNLASGKNWTHSLHFHTQWVLVGSFFSFVCFRCSPLFCIFPSPCVDWRSATFLSPCQNLSKAVNTKHKQQSIANKVAWQRDKYIQTTLTAVWNQPPCADYVHLANLPSFFFCLVFTFYFILLIFFVMKLTSVELIFVKIIIN